MNHKDQIYRVYEKLRDDKEWTQADIADLIDKTPEFVRGCFSAGSKNVFHIADLELLIKKAGIKGAELQTIRDSWVKWRLLHGTRSYLFEILLEPLKELSPRQRRAYLDKLYKVEREAAINRRAPRR